MSAALRFACTGCGACCNGHHVPLTLAESRAWAADGGQVIVLLEAFVIDGPGMPLEQREHVMKRTLAVPCGTADVRVSATFAAFNPGACRHLDAQQRCGIYERRPLVCRIYPAEINPHLPLRPANKDCPAEAWEQGPVLIVGQQVQDAALLELIERSRQADRDDIAAKLAICEMLGITVSAVKGRGFTAWLPDMQAFAQALGQVDEDSAHPTSAWVLHVEDEHLIADLDHRGLATTADAPVYYAYLGF